MENRKTYLNLTWSSVLGFVFIVLKLIHPSFPNMVGTWSWWWVTSPFWIPWALFLFLLTTVFIGMAIAHFIDEFFDRKRSWTKKNW